jgi:Protein of unknown function (DUF998)
MNANLKKEPVFLKVCVILSLLGFIGMFVANVVGGMMVPNYDPVADTISDLGAGQHAIIQDVGFHAYAMSLIAIAVGLAHVHQGGFKWTAGIFTLVITSVLVLLIGGRNEYGDGDNSGVVLHTYFVYGLALMVLITPLLLSAGLAKWDGVYQKFAWIFSGLWLITAPIFFFLLTNIDGLYERGLGLLMTAWLLTLSFGLWQQAKQTP